MWQKYSGYDHMIHVLVSNDVIFLLLSAEVRHFFGPRLAPRRGLRAFSLTFFKSSKKIIFD